MTFIYLIAVLFIVGLRAFHPYHVAAEILAITVATEPNIHINNTIAINPILTAANFNDEVTYTACGSGTAYPGRLYPTIPNAVNPIPAWPRNPSVRPRRTTINTLGAQTPLSGLDFNLQLSTPWRKPKRTSVPSPYPIDSSTRTGKYERPVMKMRSSNSKSHQTNTIPHSSRSSKTRGVYGRGQRRTRMLRHSRMVLLRYAHFSNLVGANAVQGKMVPKLHYGTSNNTVRTRGNVVSSLAEKGLSSTRAATKASSLEAILLYVELDTAGPVIEELLPSLGNKQPKVVAATLAALTAIFHNFGCKTADPKPVLKILPKAFGHADKNVRAEATNLTLEFYRWLRDAMKPMFWGELKPTQQTDLEAQFEKLKAEPAPKQERFLRSQQAAMARAPPPGADAGPEEEEEEEEVVEVDVFDLAEPQDVLSKVSPDFSDQLASSKWKERKEACEALFKILDVPRIKDGDYGEITRGLAKCMKDANVAVVTTAANCIEVLAKGLRKPFGRYRSTIMGPVLERLKEKKAAVADALGAALDQVFMATSLGDCLEEILECLKHKNPQVKEGTMKFLIRSLKTTREAPAKPEVASIAEAGKKLLSESSEGLRSGGAEVLGTLMKIMGERAMGPHLEGLDEIRKTKIKEFFDAAEVKAKDKPKPPPQAAPPKAAAAPAVARKVVAKKPAAAKKAPAPPSIYAQQPQAALEPQPTGRTVSKLGTKPGLKAPLKRTLAGPGGAPAPNLASPRRPLSQAPAQMEEEVIPAPRIGLGGRGLAGRPLGKPAPAARMDSPSPPPSSGFSALEKAELDELRLDKDRLLRNCDDLRQERSRLNSEVQELRNQNAQLIEDHTRDMLSIKAKETQLVRARSEAEAADAMCAQLRREMERLKRALTAAERAGSGPVSPGGMGERSMSGGSDEAGIYRDTGMYGQEGRRTPGFGGRGGGAGYGEEKENGNGFESPGAGMRKLRSPDLLSRGLSRTGSASSGRSPAREAYRGGREASNPSPAPGDGQPVESWKRAAEVTSALKAKIEQMKARQGISRP